jgi:hypothetical protein
MLQKGALAVYESDKPGTQPKVIVFQYNPEQLKRSLANRAPENPPSNTGGAKEDVLRVGGPPVENINLTVALNAVDQQEGVTGLNERKKAAQQVGLHPALATLEMLLYPTSLWVQHNQQLAKGGAVQITSERLPLVLLIWGKSRVVPVTLTSFSISEEAFDTTLNPIQAKVELGLRVLTYMELKKDKLGSDTYVAYQRQKETFAQSYSAGDNDTVSNLTGFNPESHERPPVG